MIDQDGPEWAVTTFWLMAGTYAVILILVLSLFVVGLALGPSPASGTPPSVDFDESPRDVVSDTIDRHRYRDYAYEHWVRYTNLRTGNVTGGIVGRFHVEQSASRLRSVYWMRPAGRALAGNLSREQWHTEQGLSWGRALGESGWHRLPDEYEFEPSDHPQLPQPLPERGSLTVLQNNETHYVARANSSAHEADDPTAIERTTTTIVVAKQPDPHLERYVIHGVGDRREMTRVVRVTNYRTATAPPPDAVPPVTIHGLVQRSVAGLDRLV